MSDMSQEGSAQNPTPRINQRVLVATLFGLLCGGYAQGAADRTIPAIMSMVQRIELETAYGLPGLLSLPHFSAVDCDLLGPLRPGSSRGERESLQAFCRLRRTSCSRHTFSLFRLSHNISLSCRACGSRMIWRATPQFNSRPFCAWFPLRSPGKVSIGHLIIFPRRTFPHRPCDIGPCTPSLNW